MSMEAHAEHHTIRVGKNEIEFRLKHSRRKTLGITVKPDARVFVTAPNGVSLDKVKSKVRGRALWIRRQQRFFHAFLPPVPARRYVSGETHRYLGRQYRLKVTEGNEESAKLAGRFLRVVTRRKRDRERVRSLVEGWYIERAQVAFDRSLSACLGELNGDVKFAPRLRVRRMVRRWGSCTRRGHIYLNPELVQAAPSCIEYVVMHELCHLVHPHHGRQFYALLRRVMPDWERRKARLELLGT
jgi:predicted metal-dependent hydrolase